MKIFIIFVVCIFAITKVNSQKVDVKPELIWFQEKFVNENVGDNKINKIKFNN